MHFTYAEELKTRFTVTAHFYNIACGDTFVHLRNCLEIQAIGSSQQDVDAIVIMMNPGSSRPLEANSPIPLFSAEQISRSDWSSNIRLVPTQPDNAQYQIMRLMLLRNWQYVRVLNLSDIRAGNAASLLRVHETIIVNTPTLPHSVFDEKRRKELQQYITGKQGAPILLCWGNSILRYLEQTALAALPLNRVVYLQDSDGKAVYRYPSPYMKPLKIEWLQLMNEKLNDF